MLLAELPLLLQLFIPFCFGVIIGSFLNVVLYRFHTGKSLSGHSHCLSCGRRLSPGELIPLFSYIGLRGKCRGCKSYIPIRYFLVEFATGLLFTLVATLAVDYLSLALGLLLVSVLVLVAVYDLRHFIIPDEFVFWLTGIAFVFLGSELWVSRDPVLFAGTISVAFLGSLFFFALWRMSEGRWVGFGDVKLAFPLGLLVGCTGVFSMIVLSFWVGAIVGVVLLCIQWLVGRGKRPLRFLRRTLTMKSALPFAPFLIVGFLLVWFWQVNVVALLTYGA
jgi:prepilin signal peptidase PulO-like enzyme (type II secretory pathway)